MNILYFFLYGFNSSVQLLRDAIVREWGMQSHGSGGSKGASSGGYCPGQCENGFGLLMHKKITRNHYSLPYPFQCKIQGKAQLYRCKYHRIWIRFSHRRRYSFFPGKKIELRNKVFTKPKVDTDPSNLTGDPDYKYGIQITVLQHHCIVWWVVLFKFMFLVT
jgi:hypothetical protein